MTEVFAFSTVAWALFLGPVPSLRYAPAGETFSQLLPQPLASLESTRQGPREKPWIVATSLCIWESREPPYCHIPHSVLQSCYKIPLICWIPLICLYGGWDVFLVCLCSVSLLQGPVRPLISGYLVALQPLHPAWLKKSYDSVTGLACPYCEGRSILVPLFYILDTSSTSSLSESKLGNFYNWQVSSEKKRHTKEKRKQTRVRRTAWSGPRVALNPTRSWILSWHPRLLPGHQSCGFPGDAWHSCDRICTFVHSSIWGILIKGILVQILYWVLRVHQGTSRYSFCPHGALSLTEQMDIKTSKILNI